MTWSSDSAPWSPANAGWLRLIGSWFLLPLTAGIYTAEALLRWLREVQQTAEASLATMTMPADGVAVPAASGPIIRQQAPPAAPAAGVEPLERREPLMDTNLSDDMVKLVRFTIVTIKRDDEHILGEGKHEGEDEYPDPPHWRVARGEKIVTTNMTEDAFGSWVISEYFSKDDSEPVDREDRKYLRVFHEVLRRWAKQDREFEKSQLAFLGGIEDALKKIASKP